MYRPILATKLYIPLLRPKIVVRQRLLERLNEGIALGRKLTLVSASAGFGKTTLVSEWITRCGRPALWLSLDDSDNDPVRFVTYLVANLQRLAPKLGEGVLAALQSSQPPPQEVILMTLLNEMMSISHDFVLVLDDYHLIDAPSVDAALTFLVEHLPPQMHLVIATREDPQLPLARCRAKGDLTELRGTDLCFTFSETAEFLNGLMGLQLSEGDIAMLETRTEGWVAGLQMVGLSLQGRADTTRFIQDFTGSHRFVLDYLIEEVLQHQPEAIRDFLLHTCILDRLNGSLCDAVIGRSDSGEVLEVLERNNLFVVPLDDNRQWYRYHHLFADVLLTRLRTARPDRVLTLHQRASTWYEQNGLLAEAIHHALAAQDFEQSARLIELTWADMDRNFQSNTWLGWVKILPEELIRLRPVLSVGYAWALLNAGALDASEARLQDAERCLDSLGEIVIADEVQFRSLPATIATARAYRALALGDVPSTIICALRALALLAEDDHERRGAAVSLLGLAQYVSGDLDAADHSLSDFMVTIRKAGQITNAISIAFVIGDIRTRLGRLHEVDSIYQQALQLAASQGESLPIGTSDLYRGISELARERGELDTAIQHLLTAEKLGERLALTDWTYRLCLAKSQLREAQGDWESALTLLDEAERVHIMTPIPDVRPVPASKTRLWLRQGKLNEALAWAHENNLTVADDLSYMREYEHLTLARILVLRHQVNPSEKFFHETLQFLNQLLQAAEAGQRMGSVIEILVLQALTLKARGNGTEALIVLERALVLAEPQGYLRLFVDEGTPMAELLAEAIAQGIMSAYAGKLLAAFGEHNPHKTLAQALIEPLSQRELEVLQLLALELSNQEIGERLYIALDTVKGHNRKIFDKLQVQTRVEAAARARELGLI